MPSYTRPTKSTGQSVFIDNVPLPASDLEGEFTAINTALGNCAPTTGIDAAAIDDYSATAAEQKTQTDPGTGSSLSPAGTLEEEIARLRYTISRLAHGITAPVRYDGSSNVSCAWLDIPASGVNLATNGGFEGKTTGSTAAPDGWNLVATPTTCSQVTTALAMGAGKAINIISDAANEGISQTFTALKASTRYLVAVKARANSGTAKLTVTGADAASQFRDVTVTSASATFVTLSAIVQTDSTPTALVVSLLAAANGDDVEFDHFGVYECVADFELTPTGYTLKSEVTTATAGHYVLNTATDSGCSVAVVVPAPGFRIRVTCLMVAQNDSAGSNNFLTTLLKENGSGVMVTRNNQVLSGVVSNYLEYVNRSPTPGTTYTYTMDGYSGPNAASSRNPASPIGTATTFIHAHVEKM